MASVRARTAGEQGWKRLHQSWSALGSSGPCSLGLGLEPSPVLKVNNTWIILRAAP